MKKAAPTPAKKTAHASKASPAAQPIDAQAFAENMSRAGDLWQRIVQAAVAGQMAKPTTMGHTDVMSVAQSLVKSTKNASIDPNAVMQAQMNYVNDHLKLWHWWTEKLLGKDTAPMMDSGRDRRFADIAWENSAWFDFLKQHYLLNAHHLQGMIAKLDGIDDHTRHQLNFFTRQFIDAMSPTNCAFTNPEVMRVMIETNGDSVVQGLTQLLSDINRGGGELKISMTDENAFELGVNIAATPGKVIYENDLMQLIQYEPLTKDVYKVPLLITPAWINKYYILDLTAERSCIKWLVEQGYTVFVISWVNPDAKLGRKKFDDYLKNGPLTALDVIERITGSTKTAMVGYCLGGTLTAIALAYLKTHGEEKRVASVTYLTTLIDFKEAGDISVFIDDSQLEALEERMSERGFLEASEMATTFNMLRSNDLIWSFVINNYLLGKQPFPFDLLYWNADSTRMPAAMHSFYLRNMYQHNELVKPGGITLLNTPINLSKIKTPTYILATKDDHIAPWTSTYAATQVYDGPITFTLADSGHIAGVINPPSKNKYGYWASTKLPPKPEDWFKTVKEHPGSWWPHWHQWQAPQCGAKVKARKPGNARYKPIEAAPGKYAKVKG